MGKVCVRARCDADGYQQQQWSIKVTTFSLEVSRNDALISCLILLASW
jgi:hypothetical protein